MTAASSRIVREARAAACPHDRSLTSMQTGM